MSKRSISGAHLLYWLVYIKNARKVGFRFFSLNHYHHYFLSISTGFKDADHYICERNGYCRQRLLGSVRQWCCERQLSNYQEFRVSQLCIWEIDEPSSAVFSSSCQFANLATHPPTQLTSVRTLSSNIRTPTKPNQHSLKHCKAIPSTRMMSNAAYAMRWQSWV